MISRMMMILGYYPFSIYTAAYEQLQRNTEYNWQAQQRLGQLSAQQYLGLGADTISLSGIMLPDFQGSQAQVEAMRLSAKKGEPLILISGMGLVMGRWCITKISETDSVFWSNGIPRKIEFSLDLTAYGEDNDTV